MIKRLPSRLVLPVVFFLCSALAPAAFAQAPRQMNTVERRIEVLSRQAKDFERDNMGKDRRTKNAAEAAKRTRQTRLEIEEDLTALQSAYNSIVLELQVSKDMKPGFAAEAARSIRKSSSRLKSNLVLPVADPAEEQRPNPLKESERESLTELCKAIYAFITNPIFEGPGTLDVKESKRAGNDLDLILSIADAMSESDNNNSKQ